MTGKVTRNHGVRCCERCNSPFVATGTRQRWCTPACGMAYAKEHAPRSWKQVERACATCGGPFLPRAWTQVYCRSHCRWVAHTHGDRTKARICARCGCHFASVREYTVCWRCKDKSTSSRPGWDRSPRPCGICGEQYTPVRINQRYCCARCSKRAERTRAA